jgi:hypothetical protein
MVDRSLTGPCRGCTIRLGRCCGSEKLKRSAQRNGWFRCSECASVTVVEARVLRTVQDGESDGRSVAGIEPLGIGGVFCEAAYAPPELVSAVGGSFRN